MQVDALVDPAGPDVPALHSEHVVTFAAELYWPATHGVHCTAPPGENCPATHELTKHAVCPLALLYWPAAHVKHTEPADAL